MKIIHINKKKIQQPKTDKRFLKVVNKSQGKTYVPGINLQGRYLAKYGFFLDDILIVSFEMNRIIISKDGRQRA